MNRDEVFIIIMFLFGITAGFMAGHLWTEKSYINLDKHIESVIQSYEAK